MVRGTEIGGVLWVSVVVYWSVDGSFETCRTSALGLNEGVDDVRVKRREDMRRRWWKKDMKVMICCR